MAACAHVSLADDLAPPTRAARIYKNECTLCFDAEDSTDGVDVCLSCFASGCPREHSLLHARKFNHPLAMNHKRMLKPARLGDDPPKKMTKLSIEADIEADKYNHVTGVVCVMCDRKSIESTGKIKQVVDGIATTTSASKQNDIKAWELEIQPCEHTLCLEQQEAKALQSEIAHCQNCELKENLWLCLTCGNLGCGRQQFGGLSGNGHGMKHYEASKHTVSVKLGTITPEGNADVFCYTCGEERADTELAGHLARFGINIATQQKTEKNLVEMQIEQNLEFDFNMTTTDGTKLTPVYGSGLTGLRNLGNSCYMSSVVQSLFRLKEFRERYLQQDTTQHVQECRTTSLDSCWTCQMHKLADGLFSGRYSKSGSIGSEQNGIALVMFKALVGKDHAEFGTMKQQDASEFLQHLLKLIQQHERKTGKDPSHIFGYKTRDRLQCNGCHRVQHTTVDNNGPMDLQIPSEKLQQALVAEKENLDDNANTEKTLDVDLFMCLDYVFAEETIDFECGYCKCKSQATKSSGFETFPQVLALTVQRFAYDNWVPKKTNIKLKIPDGPLDLMRWKVKECTENEELLPDKLDDDNSKNDVNVDAAAMDQLLAMGFPPVRCQRALITTGNQGFETAMNWLFEHMDDPDIDTPIPTSNKAKTAASTPVDEGSVSMLMDMGFSRPQALKALKETNGDMERSVEYLFSHADSMDTSDPNAAVEDSTHTDTGVHSRSDVANKASYIVDSFINHKGPSMHCGHYVCHIRDTTLGADQPRWVLINDNCVVEQPDPYPMMEEAYVMFLRRI